MSKRGEEQSKPPASARVAGCFSWLLILALFGGGGYWGYQLWQKNPVEEVERVSDVAHLERGFGVAMEKRRLEEAELWISRMEAAGAEVKILRSARERLDQGRAEERGQEIAFLLLNARAALESDQLEEAEKLCDQIEKLEEKHREVAEIRGKIAGKRKTVAAMAMVREIENDLADEKWAQSEKKLATFAQENPNDARLAKLHRILRLGKEKERLRIERAAKLVEEAKALDQGTYSEEALRLLEEAVRLHPSKENKAVYERMSSYGRVLKVPSEHTSITAALKLARANDRIMVANGIYYESLKMPSGVTLVGESMAGTVIECPAETGAVVSVPEGVTSVRLAALTLRHSGLVNDEERFSIVVVDGGKLEGNDLRLIRASGHGVAVLNGGSVKLQRCVVTDSGWDGIAVRGEGSTAELIKVRAEKNLQHGIDFWDGGSGKVVDSVVTGNGLNGILVIEGEQAIEVLRTKSEKNREIGVVVSGGAGFSLKDSEITGNLLGGVFLGKETRGVRLEENRIAENGEAGLVVEKGAEVEAESQNEIVKNTGRQIWRDAVFPEAPGVQTGAPPPAPPLEEGKKEGE